MSAQQEPTAVAIARAHVEAWSNHDYDAARTGLADGVHVVATTVDPMLPKVDLTGVEDYMRGLQEFAQAVVAGTTTVDVSYGDDTRALLQVTSRVKFGPDAPEMTLPGARLYRLDENQKIAEEHVIFFALPQ
ncbi:MAG: nuclear transport factor 2 family protein [Solirubrobacterales bacterium]|nr:nuclear transport factor 2 family protein [Solirubrobacterales bacterium]